MPDVIGMLRVKNEARWIERSIRSIRGICSQILVMDDGSTDGTPELAKSAGAEVLLSPFAGQPFDEIRDKNWLYGRVSNLAKPGDWVLCIDGDEELRACDVQRVRHAVDNDRHADLLAFWFSYLWDSEDRERTDGVYGHFSRPSLFRHRPGLRFNGGSGRKGLHCGNVPRSPLAQMTIQLDARLMHYGYLLREDRVKKFKWYRQADPGNLAEDEYRHIVVGDLPEYPAEMKLRHGGPLRIEKAKWD